MLKGKSLIELATAVQEQASRKMDVVADTRNVVFNAHDGKSNLAIMGSSESHIPAHVAEVTPHTFNQITEHAGVPRAYAQRMLTEAPQLLEHNVNHWLRAKPAMRMIRTLTGATKEGPRVARAFLSNRYHRLDFDQMLGAVLPTLLGTNLQVLSSELTDRKMYVKVVFPELEGEVRRGDVVRYGFTLSGSEIGEGAMVADPFIERLICLNGLRLAKEVDDTRMRRAHLGRALEAGVDYYREDTVKADDNAIMLKLRDTITAFQDQNRWKVVLERLRAAADTEAAKDPIATVERATELLMLPKPEQNSVLTNFLRDGDLTKWGLVNAITAVANTAETYDRACELEDIGGRVLALPANDWHRLAAAA